MARVAVALSGGVDSSVTLLLLHEAGHDVFGITMKHLPAELAGDRVGSCCSPTAVAAAGRLCARLGVPHYVFDLEREFAEEVMAPTARAYAEGRTPNPCVLCNRRVKLGALERRAAALGSERMATGHYARLEGRRLFRAVDATRDQSYFLYRLRPDVRARLLFPLGALTKDEVRERARAAGIEAGNAPDSQDVCFAPGGDFSVAFRRFAPSALEPGPVVDGEGREVGRHGGLGTLTVGQRRGLGALRTNRPGERLYVRALDPSRNAAVVGERPVADAFAVGECVIDEDVPASFEAGVRVRSQADAVSCRVRREGESVRVVTEAPVAAVTPGQSAVFYDGDRVLGGGFIL